MSPVLKYALPAMGVCRTFPRDLVFSPTTYSGLGIKHLHTLQEIARKKDIIHHTYIDSTTGKLYRTSLEFLLLELGISTNISKIDYNRYHILATNSLIKNTWEFLNKHNIHIEHDITIPKNTIRDINLMQEFCKKNPSVEELEAINQCRIYLNAYYVSDLATASGRRLSEHAWEGIPRQTESTNEFIWPKQGKPTKSSWIIWKKFLKSALLGRGFSLKHDLGNWLRRDYSIWQWHFAPTLDSIIHLTERNEILVHKRFSAISYKNKFSHTGMPIPTLPTPLLKASVKLMKRNFL
jgi:hypothetical protein